MRWTPRPPRDTQAWYWAFALVPHTCVECHCKFWLEWCGKRRTVDEWDICYFQCNRCFVLAQAQEALPAP